MLISSSSSRTRRLSGRSTTRSHFRATFVLCNPSTVRAQRPQPFFAHATSGAKRRPLLHSSTLIFSFRILHSSLSLLTSPHLTSTPVHLQGEAYLAPLEHRHSARDSTRDKGHYCLFGTFASQLAPNRHRPSQSLAKAQSHSKPRISNTPVPATRCLRQDNGYNGVPAHHSRPTAHLGVISGYLRLEATVYGRDRV